MEDVFWSLSIVKSREIAASVKVAISVALSPRTIIAHSSGDNIVTFAFRSCQQELACGLRLKQGSISPSAADLWVKSAYGYMPGRLVFHNELKPIVDRRHKVLVQLLIFHYP